MTVSKRESFSRRAAVAAATALLIGSSIGGLAQAASPRPAPPLVLGVQDGSPDFVQNFNPFSPNTLDGWFYMYEPLYMVNLLNGKQSPWLATSYTWKSSTQVSFTLRSGVRWSNGQPFTAQDVVFTFTLLKHFPALDLSGVWSVLKSVSASGNKVTFSFQKPDVPMWFFLASTPIVSKAQWSKVANPVKFANPNPVVTGPFTLGSFTPSEYTLKRNPLYWQKSLVSVPAIKEIALGSNTQADLMMSQGRFDQSVLFTPNIQQTYIARNPGVNHYWFPTSPPILLVMNLTKYPFNQLKFRQAVADAVNRTRIYKQGEFGYEPPANQTLLPPSLSSSWLPSSAVRAATFSYSTNKAMKLLNQIGLKKNAQGQLVGSNGKQISFNLQVPTGWTDWIEDCQIIASELGQLGMAVHVVTPSVTTDYTQVGTGNFDAAITYENSTPNPYLIYNYVLSSTETAPIGQPLSFSANVERYRNPKVDALLVKFAAATNPSVQKSIVKQLAGVMTSDVPVVALAWAANWNEYQTNHYVGWATPQNPYTDVGDTYPDTLELATHLRPAK